MFEAQIWDSLYRRLSLPHEHVEVFEELILYHLLHGLLWLLLLDSRLLHFYACLRTPAKHTKYDCADYPDPWLILRYFKTKHLITVNGCRLKRAALRGRTQNDVTVRRSRHRDRRLINASFLIIRQSVTPCLYLSPSSPSCPLRQHTIDMRVKHGINALFHSRLSFCHSKLLTWLQKFARTWKICPIEDTIWLLSDSVFHHILRVY